MSQQRCNKHYTVIHIKREGGYESAIAQCEYTKGHEITRFAQCMVINPYTGDYKWYDRRWEVDPITEQRLY